MMNLVYRLRKFFSVRMKSEVGPEPDEAAAPPDRFVPIPAVEGDHPFPASPRNDEREEAPK